MAEADDDTDRGSVPSHGPLLRDPPPPPGYVDPLEDSEVLSDLAAVPPDDPGASRKQQVRPGPPEPGAV